MPSNHTLLRERWSVVLLSVGATGKPFWQAIGCFSAFPSTLANSKSVKLHPCPYTQVTWKLLRYYYAEIITADGETHR